MLKSKPEVHFYKRNVVVDSHSTSSAQATVFFGREADIGIRVVVKQYKVNLSGMYREIKIFTELERAKHSEIKEERKDTKKNPLNSG